MRITLDVDDDLLSAARHLARRRGVKLGQIISELVRQSLESMPNPKVRNGALLFVPRAHSPNPDLRKVNQLRDQT